MTITSRSTSLGNGSSVTTLTPPVYNCATYRYLPQKWGGSAPMRTDRNPPACRPHPTAPHTPRNGPYLKERTGMS